MLPFWANRMKVHRLVSGRVICKVFCKKDVCFCAPRDILWALPRCSQEPACIFGSFFTCKD